MDTNSSGIGLEFEMAPAADIAPSDGQVGTLRIALRVSAVLKILAARFHYATVRIVPVVSELLNLTENVSPSFKVSPPTP